MSYQVRLRDVCKTYIVSATGTPVSLGEALSGRHKPVARERRIEALAGVSIDLRDGDRLGVIGANGAGKSTLLQLITGVAAPTSGMIDIKGRVSAILTIGAAMREEVTGRENFYLDGAVSGRTRAQVDVILEEAIAFAELGDFIDRPVRTYSTGMKARLAFAMIAFVDPEILVIDEVLGVGDIRFGQKAADKMRELTAAGRIVILVSHGLGSILQHCTRCIWIDHGRVVMDGEPEAVVRAYEAAQSVREERELLCKFEAAMACTPREGVTGLLSIAVNGSKLGEARARLCALEDLAFEITGEGASSLVAPVLELHLSRVDGESLWRGRFIDAAQLRGRFRVKATLEKSPLGENLYRLDARLLDSGDVISTLMTAFEVVNPVGQYGGRPMLYWPPRIVAAAARVTA